MSWYISSVVAALLFWGTLLAIAHKNRYDPLCESCARFASEPPWIEMLLLTVFTPILALILIISFIMIVVEDYIL